MITRSERRGTSTRRLILAAALVTGAAAVAVLVAGGPSGPSQASARRFPDLTAGPAPAGWPSVRLPDGNAVLAYPPSMQRAAGDAGSVSAAQFSQGGGYLLYLNATPREGTESPRNWPRFRLHLLRSDDASAAHEIAAAEHVRFRGGTGSCVLDTYVTKIGSHHYDELACYVQGRSGATVVVAAAPATRWTAAAALLERAVAAFQVR
jgi:hypothetical protein